MDAANLRCPNCGTHVPPTGISSAYGVGPRDPDPADFRQRSSCPNCHTLLIRNMGPPMDQWRALPAVASIGRGTATLRASGTATASAGLVEQASVASTAGSAIADASAPTRLRVEVGVPRKDWIIGCSAAGMGAGHIVGGKPGAAVGAVSGYLYARRTWPKDLDEG